MRETSANTRIDLNRVFIQLTIVYSRITSLIFPKDIWTVTFCITKECISKNKKKKQWSSCPKMKMEFFFLLSITFKINTPLNSHYRMMIIVFGTASRFKSELKLAWHSRIGTLKMFSEKRIRLMYTCTRYDREWLFYLSIILFRSNISVLIKILWSRLTSIGKKTR